MKPPKPRGPAGRYASGAVFTGRTDGEPLAAYTDQPRPRRVPTQAERRGRRRHREAAMAAPRPLASGEPPGRYQPGGPNLRSGCLLPTKAQYCRPGRRVQLCRLPTRQPNPHHRRRGGLHTHPQALPGLSTQADIGALDDDHRDNETRTRPASARSAGPPVNGH